MAQSHRLVWIDERIRTGGYPNASIVAERFEISRRQAARDFEYLRWTLGAPLEYDAAHRGFRYAGDAVLVPGLALTRDEQQVVAELANRYARSGTRQARTMARVLERLGSGAPLTNLHHGEDVGHYRPYRAVISWSRPPRPHRMTLDATALADGPAGESRFEVEFTTVRELLAGLLAGPAEFTVESPRWLRRRVSEELDEIATRHRSAVRTRQ